MPARSSALSRLGRRDRRDFPWVAPTWPAGVYRPPPKRRLGVEYPTAWARRYPARLARAVMLDNLIRPAAHLVTSPQVRGEEALEFVESPAIFVANHSSHVDTLVLLSVLPARFRHNTVVAAAADHFFDRAWKAHLWAFALALVPIERHRVNRKSAELATELLESGWNLLIYPEGGRSHDGWFGEFKAGAGYLAKRTGRPLVPVHIAGTFHVLARGSNRIQRSPVTVTFGAPIKVREDEDARAAATRIEEAVAVLADESATDLWSALRRAGAGRTPSPQGPAASPWRRAWALRQPRQDYGQEQRWALESPVSWRRRTSLVRRASRT